MNNVALALPLPQKRAAALRRAAPMTTRDALLSPSEASDLIVAMAREGDRRAFAMLFAHFFPRVKAYLLRVGAPAAAAEELAQETMLRVWRKAASYDPKSGAASTWIFVIARNLRIDRLRGERAPEGVDVDPSDAPDAPLTGEAAALLTERGERVREALKALSPEQALIIRLSYFEERAHSEIARALGIPLGTVKSRVRLAIERLRAQLEDLA